VEVVAPMIRITLTTNPRAGTIRIGEGVQERQWALATWHNAGQGLMLATTTDGQRVTLATNAPDENGWISGGLTIGNGTDAPRWQLFKCRKNGAVLAGHAQVVVSDAAMAAMFGVATW
jgi:hypothetical protein